MVILLIRQPRSSQRVLNHITLMLLARLYRAQSLSQAWATTSQLRLVDRRFYGTPNYGRLSTTKLDKSSPSVKARNSTDRVAGTTVTELKKQTERLHPFIRRISGASRAHEIKDEAQQHAVNSKSVEFEQYTASKGRTATARPKVLPHGSGKSDVGVPKFGTLMSMVLKAKETSMEPVRTSTFLIRRGATHSLPRPPTITSELRNDEEREDVTRTMENTSSGLVSLSDATSESSPAEKISEGKEFPAWRRLIRIFDVASGIPKHTAEAIQSEHVDLYDELFPEEVEIETQRAPELQSKKPALPKDLGWSSSLSPVSSVASRSTRLKDTENKHFTKERTGTKVVVLSNASKNLALSDFLRLSYKSHHIEGWLSGIIKVIQGRDPRTLQPLGHYFIFFTSTEAARAYIDRAVRLHHVSQLHNPNSLLPPLPPPPGYVRDGEDVHKAMSDFTLVPASQRFIRIHLLQPPLSESVQRLVKDGGWRTLVEYQNRCPNLVIIHLSDGSDFGFVSEYDVRRWLVEDGIKRGLAWGLIQGTEAVARLDGRLEEDDRAYIPPSERGERRRPPSRFILSFKEEQEGRRFVREWHMRRFSPARRSEPDEMAMFVDARLLW